MQEEVYRPLECEPKPRKNDIWSVDELALSLLNIAQRFNEYRKDLERASEYLNDVLDRFYSDLGVDLVDMQSAIWSRKINEYDGPCYLYFIQNDDSNMIKIGITQNVNSRLGNLQTSSGSPLTLLGTILFDTKDEAEEAEKKLHRRYSKFRKQPKQRRTEWFDGIILQDLRQFMDSKSLIEGIEEVVW